MSRRIAALALFLVFAFPAARRSALGRSPRRAESPDHPQHEHQLGRVQRHRRHLHERVCDLEAAGGDVHGGDRLLELLGGTRR